MTVKRKVTHICSKEETINRMSYFLVGNGNPKDGILFKFEQFIEDIKEIKEGVIGLHSRADENQKAAATAMSAIEKYKLETKTFEAGKNNVIKENKIKRNLRISRILAVGTFLISVFMAGLAYKSLMDQGKQTASEVKTTNEYFAPDSSQETITIRGNVYIPMLKPDSANVVRRADKLDEMADKLLK